MNIKAIQTGFVIAICCFSCGDDFEPMEPMNEIEEVEEMDPDGTEQYLELGSDYIFDQNTLNTYELILSDANLEKINNDPAKEEYVEGTLVFQGDTIGPVGIRYKGSIGAFVGCVSGSNWAEPSGQKTCTKLSMKVKINWNDRPEKFYGLNKLQFHSQNLDDSQLHERLGYYLFREMGVAAPRSVHAKLIINGEYSGLYALTEQIDGRFAKYHYEDGEGNVYKETWPFFDEDQITPISVLKAGLKTNEDENPSVEIMHSMAQELAAATLQEERNVLHKWMDMEEIISYVVIDRMIRHDDGPFHFYCNGSSCTNHNYYWYEEPVNRKLHIVPWDMDNAFDNIRFNNNIVTAIPDEWNEISNNCMPFFNGFPFFTQKSAACDKLIGAWTQFDQEYEAIKQSFKEGVFSEANVNVMIDKWVGQISEATQEAEVLHNDAISMAQWQNAVASLKTDLEYARNN